MQRARATLTWPMSGSPGVITLYTRTGVPENSASAAICSERLHSALSACTALFPTSWLATGDTVVDTIDPATGLITASDEVDTWTVAGANGTSYLPPECQIAVSWPTSDYIAGRRVRGRTFLGPLSSGISDGAGGILSVDRAQVDAFIAAWLDAGTTDVQTAVWHRPVGGAGGSDHVARAGSYKNKFSVLRSRRD